MIAQDRVGEQLLDGLRFGVLTSFVQRPRERAAGVDAGRLSGPANVTVGLRGESAEGAMRSWSCGASLLPQSNK